MEGIVYEKFCLVGFGTAASEKLRRPSLFKKDLRATEVFGAVEFL